MNLKNLSLAELEAELASAQPSRTALLKVFAQVFAHGASSVEQVASVACAAGVQTLVLSPLVPGNRPRERWQRARGGFAGGFLVGEDLMVVDVAAARR